MSVLAAPFRSVTRGYQAAAGGRLFADWFAHATSSDAELRGNFRKMLDRSRDLERNNDYQRGFLFAAERNIIGSTVLDLRMDCGEYQYRGRDKSPQWVADHAANRQIMEAWQEWGKKGTCTVCKRYSWRQVKRLCVRGTARDGNFLVRKVFGAAAKNRFGFALQLLEIDHLDLARFEMQGRNEVRFGVESDPSGTVVAYWIRERHPGDTYTAGNQANVATRVPAEEIYHVFFPERVDQTIGVPWVVSAITRLRQLGMFEEAATVAARLGACKVGFFKKTIGANGEVGSWAGATNANGQAVVSAAPGQFEELPDGWDLANWSPEYPNIETGEFRKAMLRGVATSLGMSYNTLGNDLEAVSFASSRVGLFEEREGWKMLQVFFNEDFNEPVFADFLPAAIMSGVINLPLSRLVKFNRPVFKNRRWALIDPLKETQALKTQIELRVNSRNKWIEEQGLDRDDVFLENLDDEEYAEEIGLSLSTPKDAEPQVAAQPDDDEEAAPTKNGAQKARVRPPRGLAVR